MDKQSFVEYIKSLTLNPKIEKATLNYVQANEFGEEMVENVAKLLESAADQADLAAEELNKAITKMEDLKDSLEDGIEKVDEMTTTAEEKYMKGVLEILEKEKISSSSPEAKPTPMQENPGYGGQQYNSITDNSVPKPAPFPTSPVTGE